MVFKSLWTGLWPIMTPAGNKWKEMTGISSVNPKRVIAYFYLVEF